MLFSNKKHKSALLKLDVFINEQLASHTTDIAKKVSQLKKQKNTKHLDFKLYNIHKT